MEKTKGIPVLRIGDFKEEALRPYFYANNMQDHLVKNASLLHTPHKHDFYLCVIFTKGSGIHEIDFTTYTISSGSVFFLKPGQTHSWSFTEAVEGYIVFHTQEFYELYFADKKLASYSFYYLHNNTSSKQLTQNQLKDILPYFEGIYAEFKGDNWFKKDKILSFLNIIYTEFSRWFIHDKHFKLERSLSYLTILENLEGLIETYYMEEKQPSYYADRLHVSTKHLNRVVQDTLGITTSALISNRVILEAKRLMVNSTNTLSDISLLLGYEDYAYFSRVFKRNTGVSPLQFKQKYQ